MAKKMKLPYFSVSGDLQSLIELEPILVLLGYNDASEEAWNNFVVREELCPCTTIICGIENDGSKPFVLYTNNSGHHSKCFFDVSDVEGIVEYVENFKLGVSPARKNRAGK